MSIRRRSGAAAGVVISAVALSACGGRDTLPSADSSSVRQGSSFTPQRADFELTRMSKLGLRQAFFTLTERSDGKTTAVVDFYVPRENGAQDDLYSVSLRTGGCASLGAVEHDLGRLSASITVVLLDAPIEQLVDELQTGKASVVIQTPDAKAIAWCGPFA
jgi:hypothetical protein